MKLGLVTLPFSKRTRPLHDTYEHIAQFVELADRLGYHEAFVGEHHTSWNLPLPAPLSFISTLFQRTKQIRIGPGVVALPYHHPAAVAGEIAQLDHLSGGRLNFGVGPGGLIPDMELFGMLDSAQRAQALSESLDAILELWRSNAPFEIVTSERRLGVIENVNEVLRLGNLLKPLQQPYPPVFVTAMSPQSASLSWAVEREWNPISAHFCSRETLRTHGVQLMQSFDRFNREPQFDRWRIARHVVVRESAAEAEDAVFDEESITRVSVDHMWQLLVAGELADLMKPNHTLPDEFVTSEDLLRELVIFGTPDQVVDQVQALRQDIGDFGTLLVHVADGSDQDNEGQRETFTLLRDAVPSTH